MYIEHTHMHIKLYNIIFMANPITDEIMQFYVFVPNCEQLQKMLLKKKLKQYSISGHFSI